MCILNAPPPFIWILSQEYKSRGAFVAFKVVLTPLEYIPTMSKRKRLNFFGSEYTLESEYTPVEQKRYKK